VWGGVGGCLSSNVPHNDACAVQVGLERADMKVGWRTEGIEVRAVENSKVLHQTALIEAFNLKASIEYKMKQFTEARDSLTDMPPRSEEELDPVTLHNTALINMDLDVNAGFDKLQFLLQQNPCPPETFGNLLLLYCKYEHFDLAADVLAENSHLTYKQLSPYMYDFLYATITRQTSAEDGFRKLEAIAKIETNSLRKLSEEGKEPGIDDRRYSENASEVCPRTPCPQSIVYFAQPLTTFRCNLLQ
jgi:tetratricopeptide repeat protein 30